jgi:putative phosphoesterase
MILGIVSDSHGDAVMTAKAIALLKEHGATQFIHCGDICGEEVLDELAVVQARFVWGNCDTPSAAIRKYAQSLGLTPPEGPLHFDLEGKKIGVYHGHERTFPTAARDHALDYVFYGHTHRFADDTEESCRWINPGALHRARPKTAALLDLMAGRLQKIVVD